MQLKKILQTFKKMRTKKNITSQFGAGQVVALVAILLTTVIWTACKDEEDPEPVVTVSAEEFSTTIDENPDNGQNLGTLEAHASDSSAVSFSLKEQSVEGALALSSSGVLTVADPSPFDFETQTEITATYLAVSGTVRDSASIIVTISDVDEEISFISAEDFSVTIDENPVNGYVLGLLKGSTSSENGLSYTLTDNASGALALSISIGDGLGATEARVTVADPAAFDYEINPTITGEFQVSDGKQTAKASITVTLNDVDETPTVTVTADDFTTTIDENPVSYLELGTLSASADNGDALTFAFEEQSHPGALAINVNTGLLTAANPTYFDHEINPVITATYSASTGSAKATGSITINVQNVAETSWEAVGQTGFSTGQAGFVNLVFNGGVPVVAYRDFSNSDRLQAMKYNGSQWVSHSNPASTGQADYIDMVVWDNKEVVAYRDMANGEKLTVKVSDGGAGWTALGTEGLSTGKAAYPSMAVDGNDKLYVAYLEEPNIHIIVKSYNSSTDSWEDVGSQPASGAGFAYNPDLAINPNTNWPYITYSNNQTIHVRRFDNTNSWTLVGSGPSGHKPKIAFDNAGQAYIAYQDQDQSGRLSVRGFDGNNWILYGNAGGVSTGITGEVDFLIDDNGYPVVSYRDASNGGGSEHGSNGATVMRWNGTSWDVLGTRGFGHITYTSIALYNGNILIAYSDADDGSKVAVKILVEE